MKNKSLTELRDLKNKGDAEAQAEWDRIHAELEAEKANDEENYEEFERTTWTTIKVVCQKCGHYLNGCYCNHFGDECPHLNIGRFDKNNLAECFNCKRLINRNREVVGGIGYE